MKKLIALLLSVAMVACLFVGCGNKTEDPTTEAPSQTANPDVTVNMEDVTTMSTEEEKESVTLRFWQAGGDTVGASSVMRLLLDKFELMYPWITVEYQAIPWSSDPHTQFQVALAADDCADVMVLGSPLDFQLAGEGKLMPLDDLLSAEVLADISDVLKSECQYIGSANPDMYGKMMSVPLYGGTRVYLYNTAIFDHFGVEYPTEGMSHADLLEMAKKLTGEMNGKQVYGYGTRATTSEQYLHFAWNYGAKLINPDTMTPGTDSAEWKQGIEDYMAFYNAGVVPAGSGAMDATTLLNMFINGEIAMFLSAVDYTPTIKAEWAKEESPFAPENLAVAPLVGETYATCYTGADVLAVNAATVNTEATALLVNYLMSAEAQATYCKNVGFFPGVMSASADPFFSEDSIQAGYAASMAGCHFFGNFGVPGVGTILKANTQALINGEITVEQWQENVTAEINAKIAEINAG